MWPVGWGAAGGGLKVRSASVLQRAREDREPPICFPSGQKGRLSERETDRLKSKPLARGRGQKYSAGIASGMGAPTPALSFMTLGLISNNKGSKANAQCLPCAKFLAQSSSLS